MLKKILLAALLCLMLPAQAQQDGIIYRAVQKPLPDGQTDKIRADVNGNILVAISGNQLAVPVKDTYTITQTTVAITATSGQLIAANSARRYLAWMIIGTQSATCVPGSTAAVVGTGFVYTAGGAGAQGASQEFPHGAPLNAFQCIALATGSSIIIWEGQ